MKETLFTVSQRSKSPSRLPKRSPEEKEKEDTCIYTRNEQPVRETTEATEHATVSEEDPHVCPPTPSSLGRRHSLYHAHTLSSETVLCEEKKEEFIPRRRKYESRTSSDVKAAMHIVESNGTSEAPSTHSKAES